MKRYAFELSGEHESLPRCEAIALVEIFSDRYREQSYLDQCLIVEAEGLDVRALGDRLAMTHRIIEVMAICEADLEDLARSVALLSLPDESYRIRARRIKNASPRADAVEHEIGRVLLGKGIRADLKSPNIELRAVITSGKIILGVEVARIDRSSFEARRPHLKPFFHPGVLMPRMARSLVNLTQIRAGERLLDPFAGTCGILVEACLMGIECLGIEAQGRLVKGAICNLENMNCALVLGDAKRLALKDASIYGAVLDIPYGRSARILASSKEDLLKESLSELFRVIRPGRRMVIVADGPIDSQISNAGFRVIQSHLDRVHRSLIRHIFLCQREEGKDSI
ncbi:MULTISPECIES: THUMP domain-containing protein [Methanothrix]|jgi:tRNA (guanine10-N2)-dimethyltransferase|uniref:RNA methyltransferase n=1 Tax=Methanothrix soehngenii TaxID=2223 RepID=A0A7K4AJD1_METSH|nr:MULTISPECIES: THUMP domain-containing protein [Methanothrix]MBP7066872.1 RNA methyltransferase [Methanothrix sp.]NLJ23083.1 RNA methyltransferase [Methanothrix soehngenii]